MSIINEGRELRVPQFLPSISRIDKKELLQLRPEDARRKLGDDPRQFSSSSAFKKGMAAFETLAIPFAPRFFDGASIEQGDTVIIDKRFISKPITEGNELTFIVDPVTNLPTGDVRTSKIGHRIAESFLFTRMALSAFISAADQERSILAIMARNQNYPKTKAHLFRILKQVWMQRQLLLNRGTVYPDDLTNATVIYRENTGTKKYRSGVFISSQTSNMYDTTGDAKSPFNLRYLQNGQKRVPALGIYQVHPITLGAIVEAARKVDRNSAVEWVNDNYWFLNKLDPPMQFMLNMIRNEAKAKSLKIKTDLIFRSEAMPDLRGAKLADHVNSKIWFGYGNELLRSNTVYSRIKSWNDRRPIDSIASLVTLTGRDDISPSRIIGGTDFSPTSFTSADANYMANAVMLSEHCYAQAMSDVSSPFYKLNEDWMSVFDSDMRVEGSDYDADRLRDELKTFFSLLLGGRMSFANSLISQGSS